MVDLDRFKAECISEKSELVVQKYLIDGPSFYFSNHYDANEEFYFKKEISSSLKVHLRDIAIVGSGKLGFSIKPDEVDESLYRYKVFDFDINNDPEEKKSDLDIAIISGGLFDRQLVSIYNYTGCYSDRAFNRSGGRNKFAKYILKGWLRPDFIPENYEITKEINDTQDFFKELYSRDVNIGIYKSWFYFEQYHKNNIHKLQLNLIANL